jgi:hypothetical protein
MSATGKKCCMWMTGAQWLWRCYTVAAVVSYSTGSPMMQWWTRRRSTMASAVANSTRSQEMKLSRSSMSQGVGSGTEAIVTVEEATVPNSYIDAHHIIWPSPPPRLPQHPHAIRSGPLGRPVSSYVTMPLRVSLRRRSISLTVTRHSTSTQLETTTPVRSVVCSASLETRTRHRSAGWVCGVGRRGGHGCMEVRGGNGGVELGRLMESNKNRPHLMLG